MRFFTPSGHRFAILVSVCWRWYDSHGVYVHLERCQGPISCTYTGEYIYEIVELDASHLTVAITTYDEVWTLFFEAV